jgi:hypothetical protein
MRKNQISGVIHDILGYLEYRSPISRIFLGIKIEVNLLNKEIFGVDEDDIFKCYHEKIDWFHNRIKNLKGNLKDFKKAKLYVYGAKEKVEITYKDSDFSNEIIFHQ